MSTFLLFLCSLILGTSISAADTNAIYFFVDFKSAIGHEASTHYYERQMEAARRLPECRPAELDPQGHWGEICAGLQLSVRFNTNSFIAGQPIAVSLILRNTTTNSLTVPGPIGWFIDLFVLGQDGTPLERIKNTNLTLSGGGDTRLPPHSQIKLTYTLNETFDLSNPAEYRVYAERRSPPSSHLPTTRSGTAKITVVVAADRPAPTAPVK